MIDRAGTATHPRRGTRGGGKCLGREVWGCVWDCSYDYRGTQGGGPSAWLPVELGELSG